MHVGELRLFLFFSLLGGAWPCWAGLPTLKTYADRVQASQLWNDDGWQRLGHYEKTLFGFHSPFSGPFFLAQNGASDARAELLATLKAFLTPSPEELARYKMPPSCYFKARDRWLRTKLDLPPGPVCPEREEWKKRLNARAISLIFAASDLGMATSSFGHTFLKLSNPDNSGGKELIDYGINYAADADKSEGILYAIKGLFGFYRGHFSLLPYHQKLREYTNLEGRDIWEYPLALSPAEVEQLIDHLLELENSGAPYFFVGDNCSYEILKALEVVRPDLHVGEHLPYFVIPLDTLKQLATRSSLVGPGRYRQSLKSDYMESYRRLGRRERGSLHSVIENLKISPEFNLKPQEKAEVLEAAMKYYALRAYQEDQDLDEPKYKLSVQRARLGVFADLAPPEVPRSPDQSHDSSAIALGQGEATHGQFTSLKFRSAFHELEQNDAGAVPFSHSEILSLETRRYAPSGRLTFDRLTLIHLLNTSPVNELEHGISWKARYEIVDPWRSELETGFGYSFDGPFPFRTRAVLMLTGQYEQTQPRVGPNAILIARFADRLGASLDSGFYCALKGKGEYQVRAKLDGQLARNWDLVVESLGANDRQIRLQYGFLL